MSTIPPPPPLVTAPPKKSHFARNLLIALGLVVAVVVVSLFFIVRWSFSEQGPFLAHDKVEWKGMKVDLPSGWVGMKESDQVRAVDTYALLNSRKGAAAIALSDVDYEFEFEGYSQSVEEALTKAMSAKSQGWTQKTIAGAPGSCLEMLDKQDQKIFWCAVEGRKHQIVWVSDPKRSPEFDPILQTVSFK